MNIRGLYIITDPELIPEERLNEAILEVITGGARLVQYRNKKTCGATRLRQGRAIQQICRDHDVPFIVNDDPELALEVDADGVHIGEDDKSLVDTRRIVGPERVIGVSCYNDLQRAITAQEQGADYVAFGSFYSSSSKPLARRASIELLRCARQQLRIPIVAIGGITLENGASLIKAGADALAVIHAVFRETDYHRATSQLASLFTSGKKPA